MTTDLSDLLISRLPLDGLKASWPTVSPLSSKFTAFMMDSWGLIRAYNSVENFVLCELWLGSAWSIPLVRPGGLCVLWTISVEFLYEALTNLEKLTWIQ